MRTLRRFSPLGLAFLAGVAVSAVLFIRKNSNQPVHGPELRDLLSRVRERHPKQGSRYPTNLMEKDRPASWLVFQVVDGSSGVEAVGSAEIVRQQEEGVLCAKIADALDARGEESLANQVWEQARRILCLETVDQAKDEIRIRLKSDLDR
jgi:hypothetical protein